MKKTHKKGTNLTCIGRIIITPLAILAKIIHRFNVIPRKIPMFSDLEKNTLKLIWNHMRFWVAKAILNNKNNTGGIIIPNFKRY